MYDDQPGYDESGLYADSDPNGQPVERAANRIEDLSLAQLLGRFLQQPRQTLRDFVAAVRVEQDEPFALADPDADPVSYLDSTMSVQAVGEPAAIFSDEPGLSVSRLQPAPIQPIDPPMEYVPPSNRELLAFGLKLLAFVVALIGCFMLVGADFRSETKELHRGLPFMAAGALIWMGAELLGGGLRGPGRPAVSVAQAGTVRHIEPDDARFDLMLRAGFIVVALIFAYITWVDTAARDGQINQFRALGFWAWIISILAIVAAFVPYDWTLTELRAGFAARFSQIRLSRNLLIMLVIMLVGAYFRLHNLGGVPPEMTSDHMEKILDANRVANGARDVFFANNGGREAFQMYAMALFAQLPGLGMNFTTLKLLAVIEGLLTLPVLWWLGREVIGPDNPKLGNRLGLLLAALVAVSYWHVAVTRLSLRIVLTPLVAALLLIYLGRGLRWNRRSDYVMTGLILGFGLYTYQAVRMLPVLVVAGVGIALLFHLRNRAQMRTYIGHLLVVVVVSMVIFVPMLRYSVDFPEQFWMRTSGRLFGDDVIIEVLDNGDRVRRDASLGERFEAFQDNLPVLADNMRNALLMFHWKGDVAWINGMPNAPALDPFSGALLLVGLGAWAAYLYRRPDPVIALVPVMVIIMLLPSALSIAAPLENPSATRTSGSLPAIYLLAALPLALVATEALRLSRSRLFSLVLAAGLVLPVLGAAYAQNYATYFDDYAENYRRSWASHSIPGDILHDFAQNEGSYGNAFIVGYQHWLDHRIVGIEAGTLDWRNAVADPADPLTGIRKVPDFVNDRLYCSPGDYDHPLEPDKPLLFFFKAADADAAELLAQWFPQGQAQLIDVARAGDDFYTFRVPSLGVAGLEAWFAEATVNPACSAPA